MMSGNHRDHTLYENWGHFHDTGQVICKSFPSICSELTADTTLPGHNSILL
jgi:hypothetical protein